MADAEARPIDLEKERAKFFRETRYKHFPIVAKLEESPDRVFVTKFSTTDGITGEIKFKKWTQGQVDYFFHLPFYEKVALNQELDEDEKAIFNALKRSLVEIALLDKGRWVNELDDSRFVDGMFFEIQRVSALDEGFASDLDDFFNSDIGKIYGNIWFGLMRMTPQEVGKLSPASYNAVMIWATKWVKREDSA